MRFSNLQMVCQRYLLLYLKFEDSKNIEDIHEDLGKKKHRTLGLKSFVTFADKEVLSHKQEHRRLPELPQHTQGPSSFHNTENPPNDPTADNTILGNQRLISPLPLHIAWLLSSSSSAHRSVWLLVCVLPDPGSVQSPLLHF